MNKDFKVDFERKIISYSGKEKEIYSALELYSFLMDVFDEPENMRYDIPIIAKPKGKFELINGWALDKKARKHISGKVTTSFRT